jgi:hypothetical protein
LTSFQLLLLQDIVGFSILLVWLGWKAVEDWLDWVIFWEHVQTISRLYPEGGLLFFRALQEYKRW